MYVPEDFDPIWPLGDGRVVLLSPDADGSHQDADVFEDSSANSPPAADSYLLIDEVPPGDSTSGDYLFQISPDTDAHLEWSFEDLPAASVLQGVVVRLGWSPTADTPGEHYELVALFDPSGDGAFVSDAVVGKWWAHKGLFVTAAADVDAFLLRFGYRFSVTEFLLRLHDAHLEVSVGEAVGFGHWGVVLH